MDTFELFGGGSSNPYSNFIVDIKFSDIPDFDIASRSALYPSHCHTSDSLQVPCANIGGNRYFADEYFYVCLQKGGKAGYVLTKVPELEQFTISLGELNTNMEKYIILNDTNYPVSLGVRAYSSEGTIEIYDMGLPQDNNVPIEIFVPIGLPQMKTFSTTVDFYNEDNRVEWSSAYVGNELEVNPSFLDVGLEMNHTPGNLPSIQTENDNFDYLRIDIREDASLWTIYSASGKDIYLPDFPEEVLNAISDGFQLQEALELCVSISATAYDDSRIGGYVHACDYLLKIRNFESDSRSNLIQRVWATNY